MKWLQDNLVGITLTALSGVFVLLALGMAVIWSWPVEVQTVDNATRESGENKGNLAAHTIAPISDFQVIDEKPLFNQSRLPVVETSDTPDEAEEVVVEAKDAPVVRLTGIIITPSMKIASLTPADAKQESVMAHEGQALKGEFAGWRVGAVKARTVMLESNDGQKLELELEVHDVAIKEPPKPVPAAKPAEATTAQGEQAVDDEGEPLSRAEQIRQRIAERREELRLQQEQQTQNASKQNTSAKSTKPEDYKSAIRAQMLRNKKDQSSDDKKDG